MIEGKLIVQQMIQLDQYYLSDGAPRTPLSLSRLEEAVGMAAIWKGLVATGKYKRFLRGLSALREAVMRNDQPGRIHQFVRSIEALVVPQPPTRPYVRIHDALRTRSEVFCVPGTGAIVSEAYKMRCDVEHVEPLDRTLQKYPEADRRAVATLRIRQVDALARTSYLRVLTDSTLRESFESDDTIRAFWSLDRNDLLAIWGQPIDVIGFRDDDCEQEMLRRLREHYPLA
jgi:hypothetical protein